MLSSVYNMRLCRHRAGLRHEAWPFQKNPSSDKNRQVERRIKTFGSSAKLRLGLLSVSVMLPLFAAEGQEALRSAISLDAAIAAQTSPDSLATRPSAPGTGATHLGRVCRHFL